MAGGAVVACSLAGCSHVAPPQAPATGRPLAAEYITIAPDVSVSRTAQPARLEQATLDEHADVMAEILAIPPGR